MSQRNSDRLGMLDVIAQALDALFKLVARVVGTHRKTRRKLR